MLGQFGTWPDVSAFRPCMRPTSGAVAGFMGHAIRAWDGRSAHVTSELQRLALALDPDSRGQPGLDTMTCKALAALVSVQRAGGWMGGRWAGAQWFSIPRSTASGGGVCEGRPCAEPT